MQAKGIAAPTSELGPKKTERATNRKSVLLPKDLLVKSMVTSQISTRLIALDTPTFPLEDEHLEAEEISLMARKRQRLAGG